MQIDRELRELTAAAATPAARQAIEDLIETTWPAQAHYLLSLKTKGSEQTLGQQLASEASADAAADAANQAIQKWQQMRQQ